jgi:hypothetical protein
MQRMRRPPGIPMKAALRFIRREQVKDRRARVPDREIEACALWREGGRAGGLGGEEQGHGVWGTVGFVEVAAFEMLLEGEAFMRDWICAEFLPDVGVKEGWMEDEDVFESWAICP